MKFKEGENVEIRPSTVHWKPAVYRGKIRLAAGSASVDLHQVDYRASPTSAVVRIAIKMNRLRKAPKLAPAAVAKIQRIDVVPRRGPETPPKKYPVLKQHWTEHERGWGSRPEGATLHLTREDRDIYVSGYIATYNNLDEAPDEYTSPDGNPEIVDVDAAMYKKLVAARTSEEVRHPWAQRGISAS